MPINNYKEPGAYSTIVANTGVSNFVNLPTVPCLIGSATQGTYDPKLCYTQDDVVDEYGSPSIYNPLPLATKICFEHGARAMYCVRLVPQSSTSATLTSTNVASGTLDDEYIVIQDGTLTSAVTATITDSASSNTSVENAAIIAYSINSTYGCPVEAIDNLDGTYTLTHKIPGSAHKIYVRAVSDATIIGITVNTLETAPAGTDGVIGAGDFDYACSKITNIRTNIIVPITHGFSSADIRNIRLLVQTHVDNMSTHDQKMERVGIVSGPINEGLFGGSSILSNIIDASKANAEELVDSRMIYIAPTSVFKFDSANNITLILDGSFLAAALAGLLSSYDAAEPATRKGLTGFLGLGLSLSRSDMNDMASSGITVIVNDRGKLRVRHGLTTDTTSAETQEISVVRLIDYTSETVRAALESVYVGKKLLRESTDEIASTTNVLLKRLIEDRIIYNAKNIRAKIDDTEPRQVNVKFDLRPIYPLNWIEITIAIYDQE